MFASQRWDVKLGVKDTYIHISDAFLDWFLHQTEKFQDGYCLLKPKFAERGWVPKAFVFREMGGVQAQIQPWSCCVWLMVLSTQSGIWLLNSADLQQKEKYVGAKDEMTSSLCLSCSLFFFFLKVKYKKWSISVRVWHLLIEFCTVMMMKWYRIYFTLDQRKNLCTL